MKRPLPLRRRLSWSLPWALGEVNPGKINETGGKLGIIRVKWQAPRKSQLALSAFRIIIENRIQGNGVVVGQSQKPALFWH